MSSAGKQHHVLMDHMSDPLTEGLVNAVCLVVMVFEAIQKFLMVSEHFLLLDLPAVDSDHLHFFLHFYKLIK